VKPNSPEAHQLGLGVLLDHLLDGVIGVRAAQSRRESLRGRRVHGEAALARLDAQRDQQAPLARARLPDQDHVLPALDEIAARQGADQLDAVTVRRSPPREALTTISR
jgi:hypothetical protein